MVYLGSKSEPQALEAPEAPDPTEHAECTAVAMRLDRAYHVTSTSLSPVCAEG